jgi:flagellar protein FliO/FliZ
LQTTSGKQNRRMVITVTIILAVALGGLLMINVRPASANRGLLSDMTTNVTAEPGQQQAVPESGGSGMAGAIAKMVSALAVVIAAVFGGLYLLRKLMGKRYSKTGRNDVLDVIRTTYVGPHKTISLVKIGNRSVLVGVTDTQISTLTELSESETAEILTETVERAAPDAFAGFLKHATARIRQLSVKKEHAVLET